MNFGIKAVICISFLGVLGLGLSYWATGMHTTYGQISTTPEMNFCTRKNFMKVR